MLRLFGLLLAIVLGLLVIALIDCLSVERDRIRGLPRLLWVPVIVLIPILGPVAWYFWGRQHRPTVDTRSVPDPGRRTQAPDDDPDFLAGLDGPSRAYEEELLRRWEEDFKRRDDDEP